MKIVKAAAADVATVKRIVRETIEAVYPRYYPRGAVEYFLAYHSDENIAKDIAAGKTYLLVGENGEAAGTVSVDGADIGRLFVLPERQGKGFGGALLSFAEEKVAEKYSEATLSSSLPAKAIYMKKGYIFADYTALETPKGDFLCFDTMKKELRRG